MAHVGNKRVNSMKQEEPKNESKNRLLANLKIGIPRLVNRKGSRKIQEQASLEKKKKGN